MTAIFDLCDQAMAARGGAVPPMLASWRASLETGAGRGLLAARRQAVEAAAQAQRYADGATFQAILDQYGEGALRPELAAAAASAHAGFTETARWLRDDYAPRAPHRGSAVVSREPVSSSRLRSPKLAAADTPRLMRLRRPPSLACHTPALNQRRGVRATLGVAGGAGDLPQQRP